MKSLNINAVIFTCMILISFISIAAAGNNIIQTISIPGADLKPLSGSLVTESNGCYSGVVYSDLKIPVGSVIIGVKITAIDTVGIGQLHVSINKHNPELSNGFLLSDYIDFDSLNIIGNITTLYPYTINENDFLTILINSSSSNTSSICGAKVFYVHASEIIFYNSFE